MHPTWAGIFGTDFQGRGAMIYDGQGRSGSRFRQSRNSRDQWKALNNLSLGTSLMPGESENLTGVVLIVILGGFGRICLKCRNILNKLTEQLKRYSCWLDNFQLNNSTIVQWNMSKEIFPRQAGQLQVPNWLISTWQLPKTTLSSKTY